MTARLLYAAKRAWPNIQVAVAYLCTRVREPTEDDYTKLMRVINYLRATVYLPLIIGWDDSGTFVEILTRTDRPKPLPLQSPAQSANSNSKTSKATQYSNMSDSLYKLTHRLMNRIISR